MKITKQPVKAISRLYTGDKVMCIVIKHGWKEGNTITFAKDGFSMPDYISAHNFFILKGEFWEHFYQQNILYYPAEHQESGV